MNRRRGLAKHLEQILCRRLTNDASSGRMALRLAPCVARHSSKANGKKIADSLCISVIFGQAETHLFIWAMAAQEVNISKGCPIFLMKPAIAFPKANLPLTTATCSKVTAFPCSLLPRQDKVTFCTCIFANIGCKNVDATCGRDIVKQKSVTRHVFLHTRQWRFGDEANSVVSNTIF